MGDIVTLQDILFEGENILWEGTPDKLCYIVRKMKKHIAGALIFLLFDGLFISVMLSISDEIPKEVIFFLVGFFAIHLFPVWSFIGNVIKALASHKNIVYAITDKRIIVRRGFIGMDFTNVNYSDISKINVDVSVLEKFRNCGTVYVKSSNGTTALYSIKNPYEIYKKANKIFMDVHSDIQYPNALRPENNPGYNTKYTGQ